MIVSNAKEKKNKAKSKYLNTSQRYNTHKNEHTEEFVEEEKKIDNCGTLEPVNRSNPLEHIAASKFALVLLIN